MTDANYVPLMFQAQVMGRSLIHFLDKSKQSNRSQQQAYDWANEWQEGCDAAQVPQFEPHVQTKPYQFTWRMVTNSGQDAVIRPVIGERGWAYFPGSSMKGAFRRACATDEEKIRYCGGKGKDGELHPGILRFHGGYPKDGEWLDDSLVDIVHPQENWQSNGLRKSHETPKVQISLYQPTFEFGISSPELSPDSEEWTRIWEIWNIALERGIGSRVSAGYGQIKAHGESRLLAIWLSGQGIASKRIDGEAEFRPNIFKAALRGHTSRLFNGVMDENSATQLVKQLWGGVGKEAIVGLLGIAVSTPDLEIEDYRCGNSFTPVYETEETTLNLLMMNSGITPEQQGELRDFAIRLIKFSMLLGGFGKSWRRVDHRLFLPNYNRQMIGCHWEFTKRSQKLYIPMDDELTAVTRFLDTLQQKLKDFYLFKNLRGHQTAPSPLREAWRKENVQVWGRIAEDEDDSVAIGWLHGPYQGNQSIKQSELTGQMNKIGRIWHRMYPRYRKRGADLIGTEEYVELLTIFPNRSGNEEEVRKTRDFLNFLETSSDFKQLW